MGNKQMTEENWGFKISLRAIVSFIVTLALCALLTVFSVTNRLNVEQLQMQQLIIEKSVKINEVISKLLYKTEALAALVVMDGGEIEDFERVAAAIVDDPAILNVVLAPGGVVSNVYPMDGNEAVLGLDFLGEGAGNPEAKLAVEKGQLVFGGPFTLRQGGEGLVGRLPVYINDEKNNKIFWGLVSVGLRYPEVLDAVGLDTLEKHGYTYEIWRISPDDGQRQTIGQGNITWNKHSRYIERHIPILNADWYFRISPVRMWYAYSETWLLIFASLFISMLLAFVVQNNSDLKMMKTRLEHLARMDPLIGIYNRRYFMEILQRDAKLAESETRKLHIILLDIDHFKSVNDGYGHAAGDAVLLEASERIRRALRGDDMFARYGGEEFIIRLANVNRDKAYEIAERVRKGISDEPYEVKGGKVNVTCSCGISALNEYAQLDNAIANADTALYEAKKSGRNKTIVFEGV